MKRTTDGRSFDKRAIIDKKILKKILIDIKKEQKVSWKDLAKKIGFSEQSISHDWLVEKSTIPLLTLKKILKMNKKINKKDILSHVKTISPFWGQKFANGKEKAKKIKIPKRDGPELAEFYGIMLGDGCLFSNLKGLSVTGDKILEKDYFKKYLNNLIYNLFGLYPKFYSSSKTRTMRCVLYSKNVVSYLSEIGFPVGFKKNLKIPSFIKKNKENLLCCLRGLMDTDGSLSAHPHSRIMIHLSITSETLRNDVSSILTNLKIKPSIFNKGIMLYSKNAIRFCETIGFSNLKNNTKYRIFKKTGIVPRSKEIEMFIREIN
jgi:DNA-binding Xre family transcriptional regulator